MQKIEHNSQNIYCTLQNAHVIGYCAFAEVEKNPLPSWQILHVLQMCYIKWANLSAREADKVRHLKFCCPPKN